MAGKLDLTSACLSATRDPFKKKELGYLDVYPNNPQPRAAAPRQKHRHFIS
jgi:hypothetical protein